MRFQWFWAPKIINEAINRGAQKYLHLEKLNLLLLGELTLGWSC